MEQKQEDIKRLISFVEKVAGKTMQAPRDFMFLYEQLKGVHGRNHFRQYAQTNLGIHPHQQQLQPPFARPTITHGWLQQLEESFIKDKADIPTSQFFVNKKLRSYSRRREDTAHLATQPCCLDRIPRLQQVQGFGIPKQQTTGFSDFSTVTSSWNVSHLS